MFASTAIFAQSDQGLANRVRGLGNQIIGLHAQMGNASPNEQAQLRSQAAPLIEQRAQALSDLVAQNPRQALELAFPADLAGDVANSFPQSAGKLESHGTWEGEVEYLIIDEPNLVSHRSIVRLRAGTDDVEVQFAAGEPGGLKSGDRLKVQGVRAGDRVAAADGQITGQSVAAASCSVTGDQKVAVLLVYNQNQTQPSITTQTVSDIFFATSGRSVDSFWRETSYGKTSASGQVFGWRQLAGNYTCDQYNEMRTAAIAAFDNDINFTQYTRLFIVFPDPGSCGWAGLGNLGCPTLSSNDGTFQASAAWQLATYMSSRDNGVKLSTHEGGHNLTYHHASSRDFAAEAIGAVGSQGTLSEYGDTHSTMGSWNLGHYAAPHKNKNGWFNPGNVLTVESSGQYTVLPYETPTAGVQALKVRRGTGNNAWVWLELRRPVGIYDSTLNAQIFSGALIHYEDSYTGTYTHLVDFTTGTSSFSDAALAAGQTWVDPYSNLSITVNSATDSGLNVSINYGAVPCTQANPAVTISPDSQSVYPGGTVNYTVTVRNNDSAGCASSTYSLSSSLVAGLTLSHSPSSLALAPGAQSNATLTITAASGTPFATYTINSVATDGGTTGSDTASTVVVPPPPPLTVTVATDKNTYSLKQTIVMSATVLSGTSPRSGASVTFTITKPGGSQVVKTATTNASGVASTTYKTLPKDPKGAWSVGASAVYSSQTGSAAPKSITVQ